MNAGSCTVATSSSVAIGAATVTSPAPPAAGRSTPSSRASITVRSTRIGDIGMVRPEVVVGERRVEHDAGGA